MRNFPKGEYLKTENGLKAIILFDSSTFKSALPEIFDLKGAADHVLFGLVFCPKSNEWFWNRWRLDGTTKMMCFIGQSLIGIWDGE